MTNITQFPIPALPINQITSVATPEFSDIVIADQSGVTGTESLQQIYDLFLPAMFLSYNGNPNGNLAGTAFQLCWDITDNLMYVCTRSGSVTSAFWKIAAGAQGTVTTISIVNANGFSGSVINPTTTPAITLNKTTAQTIAGLSSPQMNVTGDGTEATLICNNIITDPGSNYNSVTGIFTAPVTGLYQINVIWGMSGLTSSHTLGWGSVNVNGSDIIRPWYNNIVNYSDGSGNAIICGSVLLSATVGQGVKATLQVNNGGRVVNTTSNSYFSISLVR